MTQGFQIGPFFVRFYGILVMLGAVAAAFVADRQARHKGKNPEFIWDLLPWALVGGIIGARLWHILFPSLADGVTTLWYLTHPLDALAVWNGGLGIPGAVIGGALALLWYTRRRKESFIEWADIIIPGLPLAQAIGRWGNFVNQELFGPPTNLPWKIFIEPQFRPDRYQDQAYFHPLFLYESIYNLLLFGFLMWASRKLAGWLKPGDLFLMYLVGYPLGRFVLEFIRLDIVVIGGLNANQTIMGVIALVAGGLLIYKHLSKEENTPAVE